MNWQIWREV